MSRRPTRPLNLSHRLLIFNNLTQLYEGQEAGIIYHLTFIQLNDLKNFYSGSQGYKPTITNWFNNLDRFEKKRVKRSGNLQPQENDFYPDIDYLG